LRLAGIASVEAANGFLHERYIAEFNAKFKVAAAQKGTAFRRTSRTDLKSNWRVAAAVLAGYLAIGFLIVATDWALGFSIAELRTAREMPTYYFAVVIVTDSIYSVAGGYLCAKIARTAARNATILDLHSTERAGGRQGQHGGYRGTELAVGQEPLPEHLGRLHGHHP